MTITLFLAVILTTSAEARLDLSRASVERLDNGLTLIMLEDRTFPVVSIQTTYRTGAKDDPAGRLGLAHFFEHMAFRGSKHFPDTGLVSEIYAAGGEWHGYTWIDSTNYFATAPRDELPLLLDIEADRMARLDLRPEDVEAERGGVLAEMNSYLNDPDSTLFDALIATHFLTHPYRNNTIGYAGDVKEITHADLREFYRRHYAPQNAIIALVGDFDRAEARAAARKKFGKIKKPVEARAPLTAEMPRTGERRVRLSLPSDEKLFKIAYPAPAASHPDFPTFLVLQALIGESAGVNFNQNDWGTPVGDNSPVASAANSLRTWIIPTAEDYVFVISGSMTAKSDESKIEESIQGALDKFATNMPTTAALEAAKKEALAAFAFDVETTEDAAHQLAYFAGIGAFDHLLSLEERIGSVSAADVAAIAEKYLRADQRTIAWLRPGPPAPVPTTKAATEITERRGGPDQSSAPHAPKTIRLDTRPPAFFERSDLSPTIAVSAFLNGRYACDHCANDELAFGATLVRTSMLRQDFRTRFEALMSEIEMARPLESDPSPDDPLASLEAYFQSQIHPAPSGRAEPYIAAIAVSGAIDGDDVREAMAGAPAGLRIDLSGSSITVPQGAIEMETEKSLAQEAVGYIAVAFSANESLATRIALYVLSHGYEGRLGREAISRRGLAYYIDTQYRPAPVGGFVTLATGVDPEKVDAFKALLKSEIARLRSSPPTDAEIAEAKRHLLGRKISAAQSNEEIAEALIRDFLETGGPESAEAFAGRLDKISREEVLNAVQSLQNGAVVTVRGKSVD